MTEKRDPTPDELDLARRDLRRVYTDRAEDWDRARPRSLFERDWLDRLLDHTNPELPLLDLGCGAGEPIAAHLIARGRLVCGIDFSPALLSRARARFPGHEWIEADMRDIDLGGKFGGIVGWDSFFHLSPDEQRSTLPRLAAHLAPGGALLLTVGPRATENLGTVGGEPVYHSSLDETEYRAILTDAGFADIRFVPEDPTCDYRSILFATGLDSRA